MKISNTLRTLAVATTLSLVLAFAVKSAGAHMNVARAASSLVDQRVLRIMVTPQVAHNDIDLAKGSKAVDVTIIGEQSWQFSDIDNQTVEFAKAIPAKTSTSSRDWDNDGIPDRTYTFTTSQLKLTPTDTLGCLTLETLQKLKYRGCDKIKVLPAKGAY